MRDTERAWTRAGSASSAIGVMAMRIVAMTSVLISVVWIRFPREWRVVGRVNVRDGGGRL